MASIPEEVVINILLWIPIKSLLRFRCVSKSWFHLLSADPHFLKLHLDQATQSDDSNFLVQRTSRSKQTRFYLANCNALDEAVALEFPFDHSSRDYLLVGICNGLVCLVHPTIDEYSSVYIWNPFTKDHITVPFPPIFTKYFYLDSVCVSIGFGFDHEHNAYKVVGILKSDFDSRSRVVVYTLGRKSWKPLKSIPHEILNWSDAIVKGNPHWFAIIPTKKKSGYKRLILSFKIKDEVCQDIQMPRDLSKTLPGSADVIMGELNGFLCIFHHFPKVEVHIWMLKDYGVVDSWSKQFIIGQPDVPRSFRHLTPVGMMKSGEILLKKNNVHMLMYDPENKSVKKLKTVGFWIDRAYKYRGSLVSPKVIKAVAAKTGKSNTTEKRGKRKRGVI